LAAARTGHVPKDISYDGEDVFGTCPGGHVLMSARPAPRRRPLDPCARAGGLDRGARAALPPPPDGAIRSLQLMTADHALPPPLRRLATGVDGLDEILGGGFVSGGLFLVEGQPGTG